MTRMLMVTDVQDIIKRHQAQIITSLKDPDVRYISYLAVFCYILKYFVRINHNSVQDFLRIAYKTLSLQHSICSLIMRCAQSVVYT